MCRGDVDGSVSGSRSLPSVVSYELSRRIHQLVDSLFACGKLQKNRQLTGRAATANLVHPSPLAAN